MHNIFAYENGKIIRCEHNEEYNKECSCCDNGHCICCAKYYDEIKKISKESNFLKKEKDHIKCSGYTGYFQLSDGTGVFILPKIDKEEPEEGMQIFTNLVEKAYSIKNIKTGSDTSTKFENEKIFIEILINMFCSHMDNLFKKGIKKFYSPEVDNLPYLKGKIKFSEHIKHNIASKEKFYCEYDEFTENIPENRILVMACNYLIKKINSLSDTTEERLKRRAEYKNKLRRYIQEFGDIEESKNIEKDFAKLQPNRLYEHYDKPLIFAEVFLSHKNYWIKRGRKKFPAIMFSLHDLFEQYIEYLLNEFNSERDKESRLEVRTQFMGKNGIKNYLFEENMFMTKMDFVVLDNKSKYLILDAKYKLINLKNDIEQAKNDNEEKDVDKNYKENKTHISQSDLYQMFAYSEIIKNNYKMENGEVPEVQIALLYPKTDKFMVEDNQECPSYHYFNGTKITFIPIDITGKNERDELDKNMVLKDFIEKCFL